MAQNQASATGGGSQTGGAPGYQGGGTAGGPANMAGGPQGGMTGGAGGPQGGHSISQAGPVNYSNLNLPGISFPANKQQILRTLDSMPQEQSQQWREVIQKLPADQTFTSLQQLQQTCQQLTQRQNA